MWAGGPEDPTRGDRGGLFKIVWVDWPGFGFGYPEKKLLMDLCPKPPLPLSLTCAGLTLGAPGNPNHPPTVEKRGGHPMGN